MTGLMFYKRKSDGAIIPVSPGPMGPPGPPVAEGGITQTDADDRYIKVSGDQMIGDLIVPNPSLSTHAANKLYVDTELTKKLNLTGGTLTGQVTGPSGRFRAHELLRDGSVRTNLGDPTVYEAALFEAQMTNKIRFYPYSAFTYEYTMDGVVWEDANVSELVHKRMVAGAAARNPTNTAIPNGCLGYRITIQNAGEYVYLNDLYLYMSPGQHRTTLEIQKKREEEADWTTVTTTDELYGWPGHQHIPHTTIAYTPAPGGTTHAHSVRLVFTPRWITTGSAYDASHILLYALEWWGGYPNGRRSVYSYDEDQNLWFPARVILGSDPQDTMDAVTKQYADAIDLAKLDISGGTISGNLEVSGVIDLGHSARIRHDVGTDSIVFDDVSNQTADRKHLIIAGTDPTRADHAATKGYVDSRFIMRAGDVIPGHFSQGLGGMYRGWVGGLDTGGNPTTGYLVIQLPAQSTNTMFSIKVSGYNYNPWPGEFEFNIGSYIYPQNPNWPGASAWMRGLDGTTVPVGFWTRNKSGDGSKADFAITLGYSTTNWYYTDFSVEVTVAGHTGKAGLVSSPWTLTVTPSMSGWSMDQQFMPSRVADMNILKPLPNSKYDTTQRNVPVGTATWTSYTDIGWTNTTKIPMVVQFDHSGYCYFASGSGTAAGGGGGGADLVYLESRIYSGGSEYEHSKVRYRNDFPDPEDGIWYVSYHTSILGRVDPGQTIAAVIWGYHNGQSSGQVYLNYSTYRAFALGPA